MFQRPGSRGTATEEGEAAVIMASRGASSAFVMARSLGEPRGTVLNVLARASAAGIVRGRHAHEAPKVPGEVALVREPGGRGDVGGPLAVSEQGSRAQNAPADLVL